MLSLGTLTRAKYGACACVLEVYACAYELNEVRSFFSPCEAASSGLFGFSVLLLFCSTQLFFSKLTRICHCGDVARAVCIGGRWF